VTTPPTSQQLDEYERLIADTTPQGAATASPGMARVLLAEVRRLNFRLAELGEQGPDDRETVAEAAQMYRSLRQVIEATIPADDYDRWDGDESEEVHLGRYVEWLAAGQPDDDEDDTPDTLPAWEAMYEPGNVSDYLIGYANSEAAAKGAAVAWLRSEKDEVGRLEWVPQNPNGGYDAEFELVELHDDGVDTGPGITVRHRSAAAGSV
jgi:hypothetical protein